MAKRGVTVAESDYPLYCIHMVGDRHILVAGGGGSSKTGVPNAMDIYELKYEVGSLVMHKVNRYETKARAVMNCDVACQDKQFYLAAGLEGNCLMHILRYKVMVPKTEKEVLEGVRKRKNNFTNSTNHKSAAKMIGFELELLGDIVTDKSQDAGFQKVVRFTPDIKCFMTGGSDGVLRCWEFPSLSLVYEVQCHSNEIDDLDCSPDSKFVVTTSKDNESWVWNVKDGSKVKQLVWKNVPSKSHRARNCRFARIKDRGSEHCLFTTHIPLTRDKNRTCCYITKWETINFSCLKSVSSGSEILSAIAVSDDGVYLGVGTISGSVSVYISFSLQRLYNVQSVHRIFVTGLEFAPTTLDAKSVTGNDEFTLFSISADSHIKAHQLETEATFSILWVIIGAGILIFVIFWVLHALEIYDFFSL